MLKDHILRQFSGGVFPAQNYFYLLFTRQNFCYQILLNFFAFSHPLSTFSFLHLFKWYAGFHFFFWLPVSCIARTFLLYSQSSVWLVLTVLTINAFSFTSRAALLASLFYITLLTSSDSWSGVFMFSDASVSTHFFLCKWNTESPTLSCWSLSHLGQIQKSLKD